MLIIGHRGAKGLAPENTIKSFQKAIDCKVDIIEFDVRTSKDNIPVVIHDPFIVVNSLQHDISKTSFKKLKELKPDLVSLDEALRFIKNRKPVIIEIKPGVFNQTIIDCIKNRLNNEWSGENIKIASFKYQTLSFYHQAFPEISMVINEKWSGVRASHRAKKLNTKFITMNERWLWGGFIKSMSKSYNLSCYTLNDSAKANRWAKLGLYGVVTDRPDLFN